MESNSPANNKAKLIIVGVVVLIVIIGLSIALIVIGSKSVPYTNSSQACPTIKSVPINYELDIPIVVMWTHRSSVKGAGLPKIELKIQCPSITLDYDIFVDGALAAKTDTDYWSTSRRFSIKDCHGNSMVIGKTDGWLDTFTNSFKFTKSFNLFDGKDERNILGYVEATNWVGREVVVRDIANAEVFRMKRGVFAYDWQVSVNNTAHPLANPIIANVLAHRREHIGSSSKKKKSDTCNGIFSGGIVFLSCLVLFSLCFCGGFIVNAIKNRKTDNNSHQTFVEEKVEVENR